MKEFFEAIKEGNEKEVKKIISAGINWNETDNYGYTSLHWAAICGNLDIVKLLISNGAKVNTINQFGETPLMWAAWMGNINLVRYLISQGTDVNQISTKNKTAMSGAVKFNHLEIVKLLQKAGASKSSEDQLVFDTKEFFQLVKRGSVFELRKFCENKKISRKSILEALRCIDVNKNQSIFKFLLSKAEKINFYLDGIEWINRKIQEKPELVAAFVKSGLDINQETGYEETLLSLNIFNHYYKNLVVARQLLKYGADPTIGNNLKNENIFTKVKKQFKLHSPNYAKTIFLPKMFDLLCHSILNKELQNELVFFLQNLNNINMNTIDFNLLTSDVLEKNIKFLNSLLHDEAPHWLTADKFLMISQFIHKLIDQFYPGLCEAIDRIASKENFDLVKKGYFSNEKGQEIENILNEVVKLNETGLLDPISANKLNELNLNLESLTARYNKFKIPFPKLQKNDIENIDRLFDPLHHAFMSLQNTFESTSDKWHRNRVLAKFSEVAGFHTKRKIKNIQEIDNWENLSIAKRYGKNKKLNLVQDLEDTSSKNNYVCK